MNKKDIIREKLLEKRPPLYLYRAKVDDKTIYLSEIIPYITTTKDVIDGFIELTKIFSKVESPYTSNIIGVKKKGVRILVMEEITHGKPLGDIIRVNDGIDLIHILPIFSHITMAIRQFHSNKIFGLGLEPGNIILRKKGHITIRHPFFPIAEQFFKKTDKPEILKPAYLSPEHIQKNHADEKSDLFTIGVILFEAVNNTYPFLKNSYKLKPFRKNIPYCLKYIIERLLDKEPSKRFEKTYDFLEELKICKQDLDDAHKKQKKSYAEIKKTEEKEKELTDKKIEKKQPEKKKKVKDVKVQKTKKIKKEKPVKKPEKREVPVKKKKISKKPILIGISAIIILTIAVFGFLQLLKMGRKFEIAALTVNRNIVEAKDKNGENLWRFRAGSDVSFCKKSDIDDDGLNEVIVGTGFMLTNEEGDMKKGTDNGHLYIINENKKVIFDKNIGRKSIYPDGSSSWIVYQVLLHNTDNDKKLYFTAFAMSEDSLDCIIYTRPGKGVESEFWHTGKITCLQPISVGNEEILVYGGTNARTGEKPVVFAISTEKCNDQSPPWGGEIKNQVECLLWYRYLPGGGTVSKITEQDSAKLLVETERGQKNLFINNGYQIVETDTTDSMIVGRVQHYLDCFKLFKYAMESSREGNNEQAIQSLIATLNREIDDDIFSSILQYQKGMIYFSMEEWRDASASFENATELDPLFSHAFYKLGVSYYIREILSRAATAFRNAYKHSGKEKYYYRMVDCYTTLGAYKRARNSLLNIEGKAKNRENFLMTYAKIEREAGNFNTASSKLKNLISINPKNLKAYILLADILADMNKNIELADSLFNYACSVDSTLLPDNIETLSWILYRKSQFTEAMDKINQAINREKESHKNPIDKKRKLPRLYYRKAIISQTLGKKEEKDKSIKNATSSNYCKGYIKKQLRYLVGSPD